MGIEDREYYREEEKRYGGRYVSPFGQGFEVGTPRTWSIVTWLVLINVAVFIIDAFTSPPERHLIVQDGEILARTLSYFLALKAQQPLEIWAYLTHGFVHAPLGSDSGIFHVGFNMLVLFIFGREVEQRYGRWEFLTLYLVTIPLAGLVWMGCHQFYGTNAFAIGASGAVYCIFFLFILHDPKRTLYIWGILPVPAWGIGLFMLITDIWGWFDPHNPTAVEAHLAGAAFAACYYFTGFRFMSIVGMAPPLPNWGSDQPDLRVHNPEEEPDDYPVNYGDPDLEGDAVLRKVKEHGIESLTPQEREVLTEYSKRMQEKHR